MVDASPPQKIDPVFRRIWVIEDDEHIRDMLSATLRGEGFQVDSFRDGRNIEGKIQESPPDLVVCDVMMPGGGGYEVIRILQGDELTRKVPVIMISGYTFDPSTREMLRQESNVKEYFDKPIRPAALLQKIHQLLNTLSREEKIIEEKKKGIAGLNIGGLDGIV